MELEESEEITFESMSIDLPPESLEGVFEILLPQMTQLGQAFEFTQFDPHFEQVEATYMGRVETGDEEGFEAIIEERLQGLEGFKIESAGDDGVVFIRQKDEMIILTGDNAEVVQEEQMEEMMSEIEREVVNEVLE